MLSKSLMIKKWSNRLLEANKIPVVKHEPLTAIKIGIVGDAKIGKSAFIRALEGLEFDARYESTLLVDFTRVLSSYKKKPISVSFKLERKGQFKN